MTAALLLAGALAGFLAYVAHSLWRDREPAPRDLRRERMDERAVRASLNGHSRTGNVENIAPR